MYKVLVTTDGSADSMKALEYAALIASQNCRRGGL
jgi:hypothetical protein